VGEKIGFNIELLGSSAPTNIASIRCLIVTVKVSTTVAAIEAVKDRLSRDSII
jgi:hypothetical protein